MTTVSVDSSRARAGTGGSALADTLVVTWRNLKRIPRIPELAAFAILQSVMFVLLFAYVFGGAIPLGQSGGSYREFLMPGIFAQTLTFASATTTVGVTDDMQKGLVDRFRSLPMARSAFLTGRTFADVVYNAGILVVLMLSGLAVGWRVHGGLGNFLGAIGLALLFTYAMSWMGVFLGQLVPTVEVAQQVAFTTIFPITFLSNVFVPLQTLPGWLQPVAEWNPVSTLTASMRHLFGNPNPPNGTAFPAEHPVLLTLIWTVVIVAIFAPLAVRRYRDTSR
ncbi:MAG TPA: ABC transporter permease [Mycobacteriales bacterium]|nr:ABC transporter permease [Mycobacteriales bacterium]